MHMYMCVLLCVCLYHCTTIKYTIIYIYSSKQKESFNDCFLQEGLHQTWNSTNVQQMVCVTRLPTGQWLASVSSLLLYLLLPCPLPNSYFHLLQPFSSPTLNLSFTLSQDFLDKTHKFMIVRKTVLVFMNLFFKYITSRLSKFAILLTSGL